jgi:hypothetical protein
MFSEQIIYLTFLFYIPGYYLYLRDVIHGQNKPNLISWFFWMVGPMLGAFFQFKAGAGLSALPTFMAGFGPLVVVLFFIWHKNAYWKLTIFDMSCGMLSLLALIFYVTTHNLAISIIFAILSDILAAIPTFVKSWKFPDNESTQPYIIGIITNTLGLLIIKNWIFSIYSFGIYLVIMNLVLVFCIYRKKIFRPKVF